MITSDSQRPTPKAIALAISACLLAACGNTGRVAGSVKEIEAGPLPGVQVTKDGAPFGQAQWGSAIPTDPGSHTIAATAQGKSYMEALVRKAKF